MLWHGRAQREEARLLYFPLRIQPMKCHGLCSPWPSQLPFLLPPSPYGDLHMAHNMVADPELQFPDNPEQMHHCWRNIWHSIYLGQHSGGLHRDQRRRLKALGLLNRYGTQCYSLLSCWLEFCRYTFLLDPKFMPSLCLRLSRFYSDSVLRFCISAKGVVLHAFGASVWFWVQTVSIEAGWKCLQSIPLGTVTSSLKLYLFFILRPILWKGLFSGNWLKRSLAWLFQGHAVSLELTGDSL